MPRDSDSGKVIRFVDLQRGLLLPLLVGGGSLGIYGGNVLGARLDNEIEARKALQIEVRENGAALSGLQQESARLQERVTYLERQARRDRF